MIRFAFVAALALVLAACQTDPAETTPAEAVAAAETPAAAASGTLAPDGSGETASGVVPVSADAPVVTVYKSPTCGCCSLWGEYLQREGFQVVNRDVQDMGAVKDSLGVPSAMGSCHTATVDGYVIEGHVPVEPIRRLLAEKPDARGLAVPGMPIGSPGMENGDMIQPYDVYLVDDAGETSVYTSIAGNLPQGGTSQG